MIEVIIISVFWMIAFYVIGVIHGKKGYWDKENRNENT